MGAWDQSVTVPSVILSSSHFFPAPVWVPPTGYSLSRTAPAVLVYVRKATVSSESLVITVVMTFSEEVSQSHCGFNTLGSE